MCVSDERVDDDVVLHFLFDDDDDGAHTCMKGTFTCVCVCVCAAVDGVRVSL